MFGTRPWPRREPRPWFRMCYASRNVASTSSRRPTTLRFC